MKTAIIIFSISYLLSVIITWNFIRIAHSKGGIYSYSKPDLMDVLITFMPILNTFIGVVYWLCFPPNAKYKIDFRLNKFFNVKK